MRTKLYCVGMGLIVGLAIAGVVQAQRYGSLIEWIAQHKVNDPMKSYAYVGAKVGHLLDGYTTPTGQQKFNGLLKFLDAVCTGTSPRSIVALLKPEERANVKIVWLALEAEYQSQDASQDVVQENIFKGEIPE